MRVYITLAQAKFLLSAFELLAQKHRQITRKEIIKNGDLSGPGPRGRRGALDAGRHRPPRRRPDRPLAARPPLPHVAAAGLLLSPDDHS